MRNKIFSGHIALFLRPTFSKIICNFKYVNRHLEYFLISNYMYCTERFNIALSSNQPELLASKFLVSSLQLYVGSCSSLNFCHVAIVIADIHSIPTIRSLGRQKVNIWRSFYEQMNIYHSYEYNEHVNLSSCTYTHVCDKQVHTSGRLFFFKPFRHVCISHKKCLLVSLCLSVYLTFNCHKNALPE